MIKRKLYKSLKDHLSRKEISLIIGPRQAGKTTLMLLLKEELGKKAKPNLFLNLDIEADKRLKQDLKKDFDETDKQINTVELKISDINKALTDMKIKKQQMRERISQLRNPELIAELNAFEEKRNSLKEETLQLDADIKSIDTQICCLAVEAL